jgi:adenosylcobinamide kinase/adenosylcobinamide-phosphate guanylyltransferase
LRAPVDGPLLIDCLTLWLRTALGGADLSRDRAALVHALSSVHATVAVSSGWIVDRAGQCIGVLS